MSEQENHSNGKGNDWLADMPFVSIFSKGGFRAAVQPGKLLLAISGITLIFLAGWILDGLTPRSARVVVAAGAGSGAGLTELDAYVSGPGLTDKTDFLIFRNGIRQANELQLRQMLMSSPMNKDAKEADSLISSGKALSEVRQKFEDLFEEAVEVMAKRYENRREIIKEEYKTALDVGVDRTRAVQKLDQDVAQTDAAYQGLFNVITGNSAKSADISGWANQLVQLNPKAQGEARETDRKIFGNDKKTLLEACQLAHTLHVARCAAGRGIFATFTDFKLSRVKTAVNALVLERNPAVINQQIVELLRGACWLSRFHPVFTILLTALCLAVWSVVGGAICRITALQFARDERIGPMQALNFSLAKFGSFFTAPIVPIAIIFVIAVALFVPSFIAAIPIIGEIIGAIIFPLAIFAGFIIALIMVGLIGGFGLMFPTIAVEGSDSFDAISRSFSYVFARPWRMAFYSLMMAVYGAVCYLFVRFFAFLLLIAVHCFAGAAVNVDSSANNILRGKLDAIWPAPGWANLQPNISWVGLNGSETIAAGVIWLFVSIIVVAAVLAFVVSLFFSANTIIYFLLRKRVDGTDLEDVFVEQDAEDLIDEEQEQEQQGAKEQAETEPAKESPQTPETEQGQSETDKEDGQ